MQFIVGRAYHEKEEEQVEENSNSCVSPGTRHKCLVKLQFFRSNFYVQTIDRIGAPIDNS